MDPWDLEDDFEAVPSRCRDAGRRMGVDYDGLERIIGTEQTIWNVGQLLLDAPLLLPTVASPDLISLC